MKILFLIYLQISFFRKNLTEELNVKGTRPFTLFSQLSACISGRNRYFQRHFKITKYEFYCWLSSKNLNKLSLVTLAIFIKWLCVEFYGIWQPHEQIHIFCNTFVGPTHRPHFIFTEMMKSWPLKLNLINLNTIKDSVKPRNLDRLIDLLDAESGTAV